MSEHHMDPIYGWNNSDIPIETCMWFIRSCTTQAGENIVIISKTESNEGLIVYCAKQDPDDCSHYPADSRYAQRVININACTSLSANQKHVLDAIIKAIHCGNGFQPCRPLAIIDRQSIVESTMREHLVIPVCDTEYCQCKFLGQMKTRRCTRCNVIHTPDHMTLCSKCGLTYYCSADCMVRDSHEHTTDCHLIMSFSQLSDSLKVNPFTYSQDTTADDFDEIELVKFLKFYGIYNLGMWVRETPNCLECTALPSYGELDVSLDPYVLPIEGMLLEDFAVPPPAKPLNNWTEYYEWRGFALDSPVAQLLHYSLTIYHITQVEALSKEKLFIVVAGADKEADLIQTFYELSALLPNIEISLTLVGPMISSTTHSKRYSFRNVNISLYKGFLHDYLKAYTGNDINVVICMNAGLSAYSSWKDSVLLLHMYRLPCYVTDFCLLSLEYSQKALTSLTSEIESSKLQMSGLHVHGDQIDSKHSSNFSIKLGEVMLNSFRSPLRKHCDSMKLPWFSNAFICKLLYD